jgi:hypothetical protein
MAQRFSTRPDPSGYSVVDLSTGEIVVLAMTPQRGLSQEDAEHTAGALNHRADDGRRAAPQQPRGPVRQSLR